MELDVFVTGKVVAQSLIVLHVPGQYQIADVLTKPLLKLRFTTLRDKLKVLSVQQSP